MEPGGGGEECHASEGGNKGGWITGILTGAERFLNAVLGSDSPSSSSSSSDSLSDRDGHYNLALTSVPNDRDYVDKNLALISEIDSKEAIENLLMQETFSRVESENLIKLIQSRVVDSDAQPISWKKGEVSPNLGFSHSSPNPNFLSLGSSPYRTPEKENEAVKEAKKWLREKKSSDCGPCVLNTNVIDFDPETGSSPVEVARSFMKSQKDGSNVLKRGYESGDPPDRSTKRVKLMLKETSFDMTNYKKNNIEESSFDMTNFKKNIDSNSAVRSAPRAQAPNEASILTAIPLDPLDPRASSSREIYSFAPKLQNETGQKEQFDNNAWMPYATCAVDPTVVKHEGGVSQNDLCSVSKLMLQDDIVTVPSLTAGARGGKARRGRAGNRTRASSKPTRGKTNKDLEEEMKEKKPVTRSRRGRGAK